jgi:hypothetical protein
MKGCKVKTRNVQIQREFLENVYKEYKMESMEDWYTKVKTTDIQNYTKGTAIIGHYKYSLFGTLKAVYKNYPWQEYKLRVVPQGYWKEKRNRRKFLEYLIEKLQIKEGRRGLIRLKTKEFRKNGAGGLLRIYQCNIMKMLNDVYPEESWSDLDRGVYPQRYWHSFDNQKSFLDQLFKILSKYINIIYERIKIKLIII